VNLFYNYIILLYTEFICTYIYKEVKDDNS